MRSAPWTLALRSGGRQELVDILLVAKPRAAALAALQIRIGRASVDRASAKVARPARFSSPCRGLQIPQLLFAGEKLRRLIARRAISRLILGEQRRARRNFVAARTVTLVTARLNGTDLDIIGLRITLPAYGAAGRSLYTTTTGSARGEGRSPLARAEPWLCIVSPSSRC